nr:MAG TPA: hypothetical protein [Caudoviricetes sp.]
MSVPFMENEMGSMSLHSAEVYFELPIGRCLQLHYEVLLRHT